MKILTLNTHSLCEKEATFKRKLTALWIAEQQPDVICLQEVNQTITDSEVCVDVFFAGKDTIKQDNYANDLVQDLLGLGHQYHWIWEPVKIGYGKYEEGLAILSKTEILDHESILLTHTDDFNNWKKRKALGVKIQINNNNLWVYTTHMGWFNDDEEPFLTQWKKLNRHLKEKSETIILTGDFNAPDCLSGQSYDEIIDSDWFDAYRLAKKTYGHDTAKGKIDGWENSEISGMRIDYIFLNKPVSVLNHEVVFDGENAPIVSDHFGIKMEVD